ncbi:MAG: alpha/beta fold hydrolase [Chloroflexota bacterium]
MGLSEPGLYCPTISEWMLLSGAPIEAQIRDCRAKLEAKGIHPQFYTNEQNAADIAAARSLLGYEQINLFGISYGTRLALTVLRDQREGIRSVTLDSTHPPQIMYNETTGAQRDFERSFGVLESLCNADIVCRTAYPDLRATSIRTFEHLNNDPLTVQLTNQSIAVNGSLFETLVYMSLYRPNTLAGLPALIYSVADGNDALLRKVLGPIAQTSDQQGRSLGTVLSIICPENAALDGTPSSSADPAFANPFPAMNGDVSAKNCQAWGVYQTQRESPAVNSNVPVLIVAGEFDPVTNPEWGALAAQTLAKAFYVRFPNLGHGITDSPCGGEVFAQFLDRPMSAPDTTCRLNIAPPAFVLDAGRTYPGVAAFSILFLLVSAWGGFRVAGALGQRQYRPAWGAAIRKMGWIPAAISAAGVCLTLVGVAIPFLPADRMLIIQTLIPLIAGVQAAMIFAPDDEPALEIQLAAPRSILWLFGERLAVVLLVQGSIALVATLLNMNFMPEPNLLIAVIRWAAPMIFLSGIGLYVTIRTRVPLFGMLIVALLWFGFSMFGDFFIPGKAFGAPLNIIQPFLWTMHAYLEPADLGLSYYWLNRFSVITAGFALLTLAGKMLNNPEPILMGRQQRSRRPPITSTQQPSASSITWTAYPVQLSALRQLAGMIHYEYLLAWRKRAVLVVAITLFAAVLVGATLINTLLSSALIVNPSGLSLEQARHMTTLSAIMSTWPLLSVVLIFVAPLVVADTITYDRQNGMSELFGGTPLPYGIYLTGKVIGVTLLLLTALLGAMVFGFVVWVLKTRGLDWLPFMDMWLVGGGLALLLNVPIAVLVGSTQPNRPRAVVAVLVVFLIPMALSAVFGGVFGYASLTRSSIFDYYINLFPEGVLNPSNLNIQSALATRSVQLTTLIGSLEIIGMLFIARFEMYKRRQKG